jgi:PEP-CTERM motif
MMHHTGSRTGFTSLAVGLVMTFGLVASVRADVVMFTASVDNSFGVNPISVPGTNNPNIPSIDPSVTVNPNPAMLDGDQTNGPNGVTYGPFGFGGNTGGNTGWVNVSATIAQTGMYRLVWEVAGWDYKIGSALAIDNVQVNGNVLYGFESGIPAGFTQVGTAGTSGSLLRFDQFGNPLPNFSATQGSSFAYLDISSPTPNTPIFDTVDPIMYSTQLYSSTFMLQAGSTLSMDLAFLTNDGTFFDDYAIADLQAVPEPSSVLLVLVGSGAACLIRRRSRPGPAELRPAA